jgi:hypothetical protein
MISDAGKLRDLDGLNIKAYEHSFFEPQPIKGARAYYLGSILHDWPTPTARRFSDTFGMRWRLDIVGF